MSPWSWRAAPAAPWPVSLTASRCPAWPHGSRRPPTRPRPRFPAFAALATAGPPPSSTRAGSGRCLSPPLPVARCGHAAFCTRTGPGWSAGRKAAAGPGGLGSRTGSCPLDGGRTGRGCRSSAATTTGDLVTLHPALVSPAGVDPYACMDRRQRRRFGAFDAAEAAGLDAARLPATLVDIGDFITADDRPDLLQVSQYALVCGAMGVSVRLTRRGSQRRHRHAGLPGDRAGAGHASRPGIPPSSGRRPGGCSPRAGR